MELSGISIARALLKDAPTVLLDVATASLDVENETKVLGALFRLLTGKTVLVIVHRMRTVEGLMQRINRTPTPQKCVAGVSVDMKGHEEAQVWNRTNGSFSFLLRRSPV